MIQFASKVGFNTEFLGHLWVHGLQPFSTGVRQPLGALLQLYFISELCLDQVSLHPSSKLEKKLILGHY